MRGVQWRPLPGWLAAVAVASLLAASLPATTARAAGQAALVKDVNTILSTTGSSIIDDPEFLTIGELTFFVAADPTTGAELWKTDSSEANTVLVKDINPGLADSFPHDLADVD